jgi:tRNA (guanine-N7-)-methyltransferase
MTFDHIARRRSVYADRLLEYREFVFSDGAEFQRRGQWRNYFRSRIGPTFDGRVIFEIGCNDAIFLACVAAKHPTTAFIGIDWKCRALHTAAERVFAARLRNVALLHGRAQDVGRMFEDGELDGIWVFHPDPCDKPRELPNRLLAEPFLLYAHRVLHDGGAVILKTDHLGYYQSVLGLVERPVLSDRFDVARTSADFWNDPAARAAAGRCFAGEVTSFESRFIRKRQPIHYLELIKRAAAGSRGRGEGSSA